MFALVLVLLSDPATQVAEPLPSAFEALRAQEVQIVGMGRRDCEDPRIQRAGASQGAREASPVTNDLMFRSGDPLRSYLLLERRVEGCSVPISFDLTTPGATPRRR